MTNETRLENRHSVDHLFLLVGGNPLPNAVAGLTLANPSGKITLVHTEGTSSTKDRLQAWLKRKHEGEELELIPLKVKETDPHDIHTKVSGHAKEHREGLYDVGLNYTGGTKAMAVHAYQAVKGEAPNAEFSYLDARTLRMQFDPSNPDQPGGSDYKYLGREPKLKLEHLVRLHDWRLRKNEEPSETPLMTRTANALLEMNTIKDEGERKEAVGNWTSWKYGEWRGLWENHQLTPQDRRNGASESEKLLRHDVSLPSGGEHMRRIADAMREDFGDAVENGTFRIGDAARSAGFYWTRAREEIAATDFCRWLDGSWLESKVLEVLQDLEEKHDLHRPCMGFCLEGQGEERRTFFEFDVVALRGHQLFGFSCSSSDKKGELKQKLFELSTRTRQFGGDEACAALVTPYDKPERLQREMRRDLGSERIKVFGRRSLSGLKNRISTWIDSQTGRP